MRYGALGHLGPNHVGERPAAAQHERCVRYAVDDVAPCPHSSQGVLRVRHPCDPQGPVHRLGWRRRLAVDWYCVLDDADGYVRCEGADGWDVACPNADDAVEHVQRATLDESPEQPVARLAAGSEGRVVAGEDRLGARAETAPEDARLRGVEVYDIRVEGLDGRAKLPACAPIRHGVRPTDDRRPRHDADASASFERVGEGRRRLDEQAGLDTSGDKAADEVPDVGLCTADVAGGDGEEHAQRTAIVAPPGCGGVTVIGLMSSTSARGGFAALVAEAYELVDAGVDVAVLSPVGPRVADLPPGVQHTALPPSPRRDAPAVLWAVRRWVARRDVDVVHFHGRSAGMIGRLALGRQRPAVVYTSHGVFPPRHAPLRIVERMMQRVLARRTDLFAFVGEAEWADFEREYGTGRGPAIMYPNVVDLARVRAMAAGAERRPLEVVAAAAYHPQKRLADVVHAVAQAPEGVTVAIYGNAEWDGGRHRGELAALVRSLGLLDVVALNGEVDDLPRRLAGAGLVVFAGDREGLPLTALEALALGTPVVCASIGPNYEVFGDLDRRGFAVGDVAALAAFLEQPDEWPSLATDPRRADELVARWKHQRRHAVAEIVALAGAGG